MRLKQIKMQKTSLTSAASSSHGPSILSLFRSRLPVSFKTSKSNCQILLDLSEHFIIFSLKPSLPSTRMLKARPIQFLSTLAPPLSTAAPAGPHLRDQQFHPSSCSGPKPGVTFGSFFPYPRSVHQCIILAQLLQHILSSCFSLLQH